MRFFHRKAQLPKVTLNMTKADFDSAIAALGAVVAEAIAKLLAPVVVTEPDFSEEVASVSTLTTDLTAALAPVAPPVDAPSAA